MKRMSATIALFAVPPAAGIAATPPQTPQAWIESVYGRFRNHGEPDYHGKAADQLFDPELAALEHKHQAQMDAGQDDFDDGNDLCAGCQETDYPTWKIDTSQQGADHAISTVLFKNEGETMTYRFWLRLTPAGWRISDFRMLGYSAAKQVPPGGFPSFKTQLQAAIKHAATQKPGSH